jgi:uncharacterized membrane protein
MIIAMSGGIKRYFLTGIFVLLPVAATSLVVVWLFNLLDSWASPFTQHLFGRHIPGLGFIIAIGVIFLTGALSSNVIGQWLLGLVDHVFMDMPIFRTIYNTMKQVMQVFSPQAQGSFRSVVLVENPRTGSLSIGFVTHELEVDIQDNEKRRLAVYVPTNHLYFGDIFLYKPEQVHATNLSIQQGIQSVISAGAILPRELKTEVYSSKNKSNAV